MVDCNMFSTQTFHLVIMVTDRIVFWGSFQGSESLLAAGQLSSEVYWPLACCTSSPINTQTHQRIVDTIEFNAVHVDLAIGECGGICSSEGDCYSRVTANQIPNKNRAAVQSKLPIGPVPPEGRKAVFVTLSVYVVN
jgi:hypothetical protein